MKKNKDNTTLSKLNQFEDNILGSIDSKLIITFQNFVPD